MDTVAKPYKQLLSVLNEQTVAKGSGVRYTHASMAGGAYAVSDDHQHAMMDLYKQSFADGYLLHLTEAHREVGPVVVDFDLRLQTQDRVYTEDIVQACVRGICENAFHYVAVDTMTVYVMEKGERPRPDPKKHGVFKDGLHIVIPDVVTNPHVQRLMRKRFIEQHGDILSQLPNVTNSIQDIYDESVIHSSGWLMYGSRKPGEEHAWRVTRTWDVERRGADAALSHHTVFDASDAEDPALVTVLSIRCDKPPEAMYTDAYAAETTPPPIPRPSPRSVRSSATSVRTTMTASRDWSYEQALALVGLLGADRADDEPSWIRVGWCLHNMEPSDRMRHLWEGFSSKSPKYDAKECKAKWDAMKTVAGGIDVGSLHLWAKHDSPDEYGRVVADMRFTASSMVTWDTLQHSTTVHPYKVVKAIFERSHFKVMSPLCYVCDDGTCADGMVLRKESTLREAYRNLYCMVSSSSETGGVTERKVAFTKVWLDDPLIRTYLKMDFVPPPLQCPPRTYNAWKGFAVDVDGLMYPEDGDSVDTGMAGQVQPFLDHIGLLTNHNTAGSDYLLKWLAHIMQRPGELSNIAVILRSEQGAGKSIFLIFLKMMIGDAYFFETANPEQDVFSRFAVGRKNKIAVNIDESGALKYANQLKNMLTSTTFNYEQKGIYQITLRNFNRVIITTNMDLPCKIEQDDRRFVMFESSSERRGDKAYFDGFARYMNDPRNRVAVARYLRSIDIGDINWINDRPMSKVYREARYDCIDLVLRFMESMHLSERYDSQMASFKLRGLALFQEFILWLNATNHPSVTWNSTNFGRHMGTYVDKSAGAVVKSTDNAKHAIYSFHKAPMHRFLLANGLLIGRGFD
jgi:hypothetical protein